MVGPGQIVGPGSGALFRIARGGEMELMAKLSQEDLAQVSAGIPATVTPVGSTKNYQGQVWQVSPEIDPQTRQGDARIAVPYQPDLRPGGLARDRTSQRLNPRQYLASRIPCSAC